MSVFTHILRVLTGDSDANLKSTEDHARRTEAALQGLETRAGRVGSASGRLAGGLGRVSPELAENALLVNDLADGLEVLTMGGTKLLRVLGPIAAAAGVAAAAYMHLKNQLDAQIAAQEKANELSKQAKALHEQEAAAALAAAHARGEITKQMFAEEKARQQSQALFKDERERLVAELQALREEQATANQEFFRTSSRIARGVSLRQFGPEQRESVVDRNTEALNEQAAAVNKVNDSVQLAELRLQRLNDREQDHIQNLVDIAVGSNSASQSIDTTANSFNQLSNAAEEAAESVSNFFVTTQDGLTSEEALFQNATAAIQAARGEITLQEMRLAIGTADLIREQEIANAAANAAFRATQRQAAFGELAGGLQALTSPGAALAAAGPIGAIVAALAQVGQLGAQGVEEQLQGLVEAIGAGIKALPEIFIDVLPELGLIIVTELPKAMFEAMRLLFQELFDKLRNIFVGRGEGLLSDDGGLRFLEGTAPGEFGDMIRRSLSRRAASRGRIARADGARRLAISRSPTVQMASGGPNLTINALGIDDGTQDQFQRRFSRYIDPNTGLRGRDG